MSGQPAVIRDQNYVPVISGQDSTDPTKVLPILINPATGAILLESV